MMERAHQHRIMGCRRSSVLMTVYVVFYAIYLCTGGLIFASMEGPTEMKLRMDIATARRDFLQKYPCVSGAKINI